MINLMDHYGTTKAHELFARNKPVEISQSAAGMALNCTQMFALKYIYRLRLRGINWPTTTGKAVHLGFETLLTNGVLEDALEAMNAFFDELGTKTDLLGPSDLPKAETARAQAEAIVKGWFIIQGVVHHTIETPKKKRKSVGKRKKRAPLGDSRVKKSSLPPGFTVIGERFRVLSLEHRIRGLKTWDEVDELRKADGEDVYLARMCGMIDAIVTTLDPKEKIKTAIMENKTKKSLMYHNVSSLGLNFQIAWYIVMALHKWPELNGLLYNVVMKPQHKGDYEVAEAKMSKAIMEDPDKYQQLDLIELNANQIEGFRQNIKRVFDFVDSITPDNVIMNTTRCDDFGGCEFKALCTGGCRVQDPASIATGMSIGLYRVGQLHEELEEHA